MYIYKQIGLMQVDENEMVGRRNVNFLKML